MWCLGSYEHFKFILMYNISIVKPFLQDIGPLGCATEIDALHVYIHLLKQYNTIVAYDTTLHNFVVQDFNPTDSSLKVLSYLVYAMLYSITVYMMS